MQFFIRCKTLTDLTNKRVPERIPFQQRERNALHELKKLFIEAVTQLLTVIDMSISHFLYLPTPVITRWAHV